MRNELEHDTNMIEECNNRIQVIYIFKALTRQEILLTVIQHVVV